MDDEQRKLATLQRLQSDDPVATMEAQARWRRQQATLRRLQSRPPTEGKYGCVACGESMTLEFTTEELIELDFDIRKYFGDCLKCHASSSLFCLTGS